jgi:hypothetical protein
MKNLLYIFFIALVFVSCEEPISLDLRQTEPRVVIDGQVTDQPGRQRVKVTRSVGFYQNGLTPRITNAVVTVEDDLGNIVNFVHNPNQHADSAGIYLPEVPFTGTIGRTYTLKVQVDGTTYEATDRLNSVIPIDSLDYTVNEFQEEDPEEVGKIYEVLMYATEPQDENNFYLFKFYRNDSLTFFNNTDIYYSDDELLAEKINGVPSPVYYGMDDMAKVEVYSISRVGYVYFNDLWSILNNDGGGMFGPIPASPRTNLSNDALGFFQVSAMTSRTLKIE